MGPKPSGSERYLNHPEIEKLDRLRRKPRLGQMGRENENLPLLRAWKRGARVGYSQSNIDNDHVTEAEASFCRVFVPGTWTEVYYSGCTRDQGTSWKLERRDAVMITRFIVWNNHLQAEKCSKELLSRPERVNRESMTEHSPTPYPPAYGWSKQNLGMVPHSHSPYNSPFKRKREIWRNVNGEPDTFIFTPIFWRRRETKPVIFPFQVPSFVCDSTPGVRDITNPPFHHRSDLRRVDHVKSTPYFGTPVAAHVSKWNGMVRAPTSGLE
ncbi:hypothetical protein V8E55_008034 [Tylopilus felleus]